MPRLAIALWIANVVLDTTGRLAFKSAAAFMPEWRRMIRSFALWGGVVCFATEFVAWLSLLSLIPLSQAVLIESITIVSVGIGGRLVFGERLDRLRLSGMLLIALGVALAGAVA